MNPKNQISLRLSPRLYDRLSEEAAATEKTTTSIVVAALRMYFSTEQKCPDPVMPSSEQDEYLELVAILSRVQSVHPKFVIDTTPRYRIM